MASKNKTEKSFSFLNFLSPITPNLSPVHGFTFIETLVYLALFSLILGGVLIAAYNLSESSGRTGDKATIEADGTFVLAKLSWALGRVSSIVNPVSGSDVSLSLYRDDVADKFTFALDGSGHIMLARSIASPTPIPLTSDNVTASALTFVHAGVGTNKESLTASFILTGGVSHIAEPFTLTKYIRK